MTFSPSARRAEKRLPEHSKRSSPRYAAIDARLEPIDAYAVNENDS